MDPNMVPEQAPASSKKVFPHPFELGRTLDNIKAVADFWCAGKCEEARKLPDALFEWVLFHVLAKQEGQNLAAEEAEREQRRAAKYNNLLK